MIPHNPPGASRSTTLELLPISSSPCVLGIARQAGAAEAASSAALGPMPASSPASPVRSIWTSAVEAQVSKLDRQLSEEKRISRSTGPHEQGGETSSLNQPVGSELVDVFHLLVSHGVEKQRAAAMAQRFGAQLQELAAMGFTDLEECTRLLERYGGRMIRVVNALSERPSMDDAETGARDSVATRTSSLASLEPSPPGAHPVPATRAPTTPTPTSETTTAAGPSQAEFQAKFAELLSAGVPPNEAAAQAILALQKTVLPPPTGPSHPAPVAIPASNGPLGLEHQQGGPAPGTQSEDRSLGKWDKELRELQDMGFTHTQRNLELLEKYQGRLVRVVNVLAGGD